MIFSIIAVCSLTMCDYDVRTNPDDPKSDDYIAPIAGTFVIGNGIATNQTTVTLSMNIPGATEMRFGNTVNERNSADWEDYAVTKSWVSVPGANNVTIVYGEFRNTLGDNIQTSASIFYDTAVPTGCSVVINTGDTATTSHTVTLALAATDDIVMGGMSFSNDNSTWSDWEAYAATASWTVAGSDGDTVTVYARFRDAAGNVIASPVSDTIIYDSALNSEISIAQAGTNVPDTGSFNMAAAAKGHAVSSTFTISNLGSADLTIGTVTVSGTDAGLFTITQPGLTTIAPGSNTTFSVQYLPTVIGSNSATISLATNDTTDGEDTYTFILNGTCITSVGGYDWTHTFGIAKPLSVTADKDNNIYLLTTALWYAPSIDFSEDFGGNDIKYIDTGISTGSTYVTKINADGTYGWTKQFIKSVSMTFVTGSSIKTDSSGNIYIAGSFSGTVDFRDDFDLTADSKTAAGDSDIFVTRINANGTYGWTRQIGGASSAGQVYAIAIDSSNNIFITGYFSGTLVFDTGFGSSADSKVSAGNSDIFVTKIINDATTPSYGWTRRIGGAGWDNGYSIAIDSGNNAYIAGYFSETVDFRDDFDATADSKTVPAGSGNMNCFVTKITGAGGYGWTRQIGGAGSYIEAGRSIAVDSADNIYVTGNFTGSANFSADFPAAAADNKTSAWADVFVTKMTSAGVYGWTHKLAGVNNSNEDGYCVAVDSMDNIYISGSIISFSSNINSNIFDFGADFGVADSKTIFGDKDIFVTKITSAGTYGWTRHMGNTLSLTEVTTDDNFGNSVVVDGNDNIYIYGYSDANQNTNFTIEFDSDFGTIPGKSCGGHKTVGYLTKIY